MNTATGLRHSQLPLPSFSRIFTRQVHGNRKPKRRTTGFQGPEDHGRRIYVFAHRRTDQVIYSFNKMLDGFHDLKQLPFNGKKTKPAKIRKDYWSPMAIIKFQDDQGSIGRSVFQKLRELKHLHEVSWPDEFRYKTEKEYTDKMRENVAQAKEQGREYRPIRTVKERGQALNRQRENAVADMAVVLAGEGAGNKMIKSGSGSAELHDVTVSWFNDGDKLFAESWSENVRHTMFEKTPYGEAAAEEVAAGVAEPTSSATPA